MNISVGLYVGGRARAEEEAWGSELVDEWWEGGGAPGRPVGARRPVGAKLSWITLARSDKGGDQGGGVAQ